jgi:hypothetical protein
MTRLFVLILFLATAPDVFGGARPADRSADGAAHQSSGTTVGDHAE